MSIFKLNELITMRRWQANLLMALAGFACGNIIAKSAMALGL